MPLQGKACRKVEASTACPPHCNSTVTPEDVEGHLVSQPRQG